MLRAVTYLLFVCAWLMALLFRGGVPESTWNWSALLLALAGLGSVVATRRGARPAWNPRLEVATLALVVWLFVPLVPLPSWLLAVLSPAKAALVSAYGQIAGSANGFSGAPRGEGFADAWAPLSFSPRDTWATLRFVLPALLTLYLGRVFAVWFQANPSILAAPLLVGGMLQASLALLQAYVVGIRTESDSVSGTFANRNHLAGFLGMVLPVLIGWLLARLDDRSGPGSRYEEEPSETSGGYFHGWRGRSWSGSAWRGESWLVGFRANYLGKSAAWMRMDLPSVLLILTVLLCALGVFASQSRGGTLAMAVSLVGMGLLYSSGFANPVRNGSSRMAAANSGRYAGQSQARRVAIFALLAILAAGLAGSGAAVFDRFRDLGMHSLSQDTRALIWRDTAELFSANWLVGVGLGGYRAALYPFKTAAPISTVDYAHNDYLQLATELGLVGLGLLGWLLYLVARGLLAKQLAEEPEEAGASAGIPASRMQAIVPYSWRIALCGSFLAIATHSLFDFNLYIPSNLQLLAFLAGVSSALAPRPIAAVQPALTRTEVLVSSC